MPSNKNRPAAKPSRASQARAISTNEAAGSLLSTVAGPSSAIPSADSKGLQNEMQQRVGQQKAGAQRLAAAMPENPLKTDEHRLESGHLPRPGMPTRPADYLATGSTVTEANESPKVGGSASVGTNPTNDALDRVRVDSSGRGK
jgi:catalase